MRARGAKATPRHVLCGSTPHRIVGATPAQWIVLPKTLSFWLNDVDGDCVTAEEAFNKACSGVLISDATVQAFGTKYDLMNGAYLDQVLDLMVSDGFKQDGNTYGDGAKQSIDYTQPSVLNNAISKGPVKVGVAATQLENAVGNRSGWVATNFQKDPSLDHCVSLCGFGPMGWLAQQIAQWYGVPVLTTSTMAGYAMFTWDSVGIIDPQSMVNITGEAWLRSPNSMQVGTGPVMPDQVFTSGGPPTPPIPVPPEPIPTPMPQPSIIAVVNQAFKAIEARFARNPFAVRELEAVRATVVSMLQSQGYRSGMVPSSIIAVIDAAFTAAEHEYPQYVVLIALMKDLIDQYLPLA